MREDTLQMEDSNQIVGSDTEASVKVVVITKVHIHKMEDRKKLS